MDNLIGQKFGYLTVIKLYKPDDDDKRKPTRWVCNCECGAKDIIVQASSLKNGQTKSCGCYRKKIASQKAKRENKYDLSGEYGVGYTTDNKEFYFDLEDFNKIKDYCWYITKEGYVRNKSYGKQAIHMHRLIMGVQDSDKDIYVGHRDTNRRNDNRKENLRLTNFTQNSLNTKIYSNNTSGCKGVDFVKKKNMWRSRIRVDGKEYVLGCFEKYEDAVLARKNAEIKLDCK